MIRKANEFITETFLKPNDSKIDLKKVQQLTIYFKIGLPYRVSWEPLKLKNREFMMGSKERILTCLYECVNKEHGLIRPDVQIPVISPKGIED